MPKTNLCAVDDTELRYCDSVVWYNLEIHDTWVRQYLGNTLDDMVTVMATREIPQKRLMTAIWLSQDGLAQALGISINRLRKAVERHRGLYRDTRKLNNPTGITKAYLTESLAGAVVRDIAGRYPKCPRALEAAKVIPRVFEPPVSFIRGVAQ